jgi:hypothetical protein
MRSRKGQNESDLALQVRRVGIIVEIILRNIKKAVYNERNKLEPRVCK